MSDTPPMEDSNQMRIGTFFNTPLTPADCEALEMQVSSNSLPQLKVLAINDDGNDDNNRGEGVVALAKGLCRGSMPTLYTLSLVDVGIGPHQVAALVPALTTRALPALKRLGLSNNLFGDAGLASLAPALRQLPTLELLDMRRTNIGDEGVASLVAQPTAGGFQSLVYLSLDYNYITNAGCFTLASALHGGALPALEELVVAGNPASSEAQNSVHEVVTHRAAAWALTVD